MNVTTKNKKNNNNNNTLYAPAVIFRRVKNIIFKPISKTQHTVNMKYVLTVNHSKFTELYRKKKR